MGAYFLTNDQSCLEAVKNLMRAKGLTNCRELRVNAVTVLGFDKRYVSKYDNRCEIGDDVIWGFGVYLYKGAFADAALEKILTDFRRGETPFENVDGHFTFIVKHGGRLWLVTDKTGVYHGFLGTEGNHFYASSSMFAVAESLTKLSVGHQECVEFLYTQATFGGRTIFENIRHLEAGTLFAAERMSEEAAYYAPRDVPIDVPGYLDACRAYLEGLSSDTLSFNCDLSGGYDTRTVAALLAFADVDVSYNSNTNLADKADHEVAIALAEAVGKEIRLFNHDNQGMTHEALVTRTFNELEIFRDVFRSAYTPLFFERKAMCFDVIIGGYGGELLRDKYSRFESVEEMVQSAYVVSGIRLNRKTKKRYLDALAHKFKARLEVLGETDVKKGVEKIYYLEKMRYWGGSRITAFNQYCYRIHPLLDDSLAKYTFGFSNEEKAGAALQRRIITEASMTLASVPSSYAGASLVYGATAPRRPLTAAINRALVELKKIVSGLNNTKHVAALRGLASGDQQPPSKAPNYLSIYQPARRLEKVTGIGIKAVYNNKIVGRYLTLEKTLERFEDKIE